MIEIDFALLRQIGLTHTITAQLHQLQQFNDDNAQLVRITEIQRDWITVHDGYEEFRARVLPMLQALHHAQLAVGDWVLSATHAHDERWLCALVPPTNHIDRRGNDGRPQRLVSNVDTALLVMGLDHDFNPRRMERYLAIVHSAGVAPVVVLSKADIGDDVARRVAQLRQRLPTGTPLVAVDGNSDDAARQLAPWLGAGQTLVMLGTSGAGKSTLTNTLTQAGQRVGGVRKGDGRGRHTTTSRSLHRCADGACIIDTPGLRSWQPDADEAGLAAAFEDIDTLAAQCQFRDCNHGAEPGCAVRDVVDADRLRNYHKLLREAGRSRQTPLNRIAEVAKWKVMQRAAQVRAKNRGG